MGGGSLIRMWDFQVEKRDLNKAGVPSPVLRSCCLLHSTPEPSCQAVVARTDGASLALAGALCLWMAPLVGEAECPKGSCLGWLWECQDGVGLPCPGPQKAGESLCGRTPRLLARR